MGLIDSILGRPTPLEQFLAKVQRPLKDFRVPVNSVEPATGGCAVVNAWTKNLVLFTVVVENLPDTEFYSDENATYIAKKVLQYLLTNELASKEDGFEGRLSSLLLKHGVALSSYGRPDPHTVRAFVGWHHNSLSQDVELDRAIDPASQRAAAIVALRVLARALEVDLSLEVPR